MSKCTILVPIEIETSDVITYGEKLSISKLAEQYIKWYLDETDNLSDAIQERLKCELIKISVESEN